MDSNGTKYALVAIYSRLTPKIGFVYWTILTLANSNHPLDNKEERFHLEFLLRKHIVCGAVDNLHKFWKSSL